MINEKKIFAWVLAAAILVGLGGCGRVEQSGVAKSGVASFAYVPVDRFESANIYNIEFTREKLAQTPIIGLEFYIEAWANQFMNKNFHAFSFSSMSATPDYTNVIPIFTFQGEQEEHCFSIDTYLIQFRSDILLEGVSMDAYGGYSFKLQIVTEHASNSLILLGYVTSQTDQIKTPADAVEFLSVIPAYRHLQYAPKSTVPENGWFGEGPIINVAYTRASLSKNPQISTTDYSSTISDWVDKYIMGNYNAFCLFWSTTFSDKFFTLETVAGEKEYYTTLNCDTKFRSDVVPEGLEYNDGSYQISFQMVIKTSKNYYRGPFMLIGFVTNQNRQIIEPCELYEFIKGVPGYKNEFIAPEPLNFLQLGSLGYDFTETKVDDASGLSVVNLRALTGGLKVDDFSFFPGDLLAILAVNPDVKNKKVLMVFNANDLQLLYQETFSYPAGGYPAGGHIGFYNINGTLVLLQNLGYDNNKYFIPEESGVSEITKPTERYRLSDSAFIVEEKSCLYLEQNGVRKLLLEGIEEDSADSEGYRFKHRISDTRFIYELMGYEWLVECGIYDLTTGEKTVLTHKNAPLLDIVTYNDGKAILVADTWCGPEYESYGPYVYDESTRELIDLDLLNIIPDETMTEPRLCVFGNTLVLFTEDQPFSTFCLYDLSSRSYKLQFNILNAQENKSNSNYYSGLYSTENYIWFNSDSEFPADYLLRIPIKR